MAEHIDRYLGLLQNNISQERLIPIIFIQTHIDGNYFICSRAETIYFYFDRPTGFTTHNLLIG